MMRHRYCGSLPASSTQPPRRKRVRARIRRRSKPPQTRVTNQNRLVTSMLDRGGQVVAPREMAIVHGVSMAAFHGGKGARECCPAHQQQEAARCRAKPAEQAGRPAREAGRGRDAARPLRHRPSFSRLHRISQRTYRPQSRTTPRISEDGCHIAPSSAGHRAFDEAARPPKRVRERPGASLAQCEGATRRTHKRAPQAYETPKFAEHRQSRKRAAGTFKDAVKPQGDSARRRALLRKARVPAQPMAAATASMPEMIERAT